MLDTLDGSAVRRWSLAAADTLFAHRTEIDRLNVFPVPDGDTGTNLAMTLRAGADALAATGAAGVHETLSELARGAVLGARGNSGVIVSQLLRGLADGTAGTSTCDAACLRRALRTAAEVAWVAVADPVEGTMLTVARAAADAADTGVDLAGVVAAAVGGAAAALARTPQQLPALARAGVVDAGGRGLLLVLDALAGVITGVSSIPDTDPLPGRPADALEAAREAGSEQYGYEVQYLLDGEEVAVTALRTELSALGDALAVVGTGDGTWNVHVHVNDVGAAVEAGIRAGRPHRITVVRFADQPSPTDRAGVAVVAVAPGAGLAHLFQGEGVHVVDGGPNDNPSTAEVLAVVLDTGAAQVVLLPNASQITGVAEAAATEARTMGIQVDVVPTRSPVQGLAAVAVHDAGRRFGDDVVAMAEAAAATRWAEVTIAERAALTVVGRCEPGDVLGLIDGEVVEIGATVAAVSVAVIDRLLGVGGELITVLAGADADAADVAALQAHIGAVAPLVDVGVFDGGQPHYPLLIGVE